MTKEKKTAEEKKKREYKLYLTDHQILTVNGYKLTTGGVWFYDIHNKFNFIPFHRLAQIKEVTEV